MILGVVLSYPALHPHGMRFLNVADFVLVGFLWDVTFTVQYGMASAAVLNNVPEKLGTTLIQ